MTRSAVLGATVSIIALLANSAEASTVRLRGKTPVAYTAGASGNSPNVTGGATPATACVLANSCTYAVPTTTFAGSPGDFAYNLPVVARWAAPQLIEAGYAGTVGSRQIGILAFHQPTNANYALGQDDDVCSIDITVDGGPTYTITGPSWNNDDKETDWNFTVTNSNFADGIHRADAVIHPCSGPTLVMEGPLEYSTSVHNSFVSTGSGWSGAGMTISDGTSIAAGNILTVFNPSPYSSTNWRDGWDIAAAWADGNTRITGTSTVNSSACTAATGSPCTGAGGAGTYAVSGSPQLVNGGTFTASITGQLLTVTSVAANSYLFQGQAVIASGVAAATTITSSASFSATDCVALSGSNCTGNGGTGTYKISSSQTVSSRSMAVTAPAVGAIHNSFYFQTNYNGGLHKWVEYVNTGGTDGGTHGDSSGDPTANIGAAVARAWTRGQGTGDFAQFGAKICVMGGGTFWANAASPTGNRLNNNYGWLDIVKAESDPQCGVAGTATVPTINTNVTNNTSTGSNMERWAHVTINGALEANLRTWADYVTAYGFGLNYSNNGHASALLVFNGTACTNSTIVGYYSGCRGDIVRNTSMDFITEDFFHGANIIVGNTLRDGGDVWIRITGTATTGSDTITGVSVPAGMTLAQLFATASAAPTDIDLGGCWSGTGTAIVKAVDDVNHTIQLKNEDGSTALASCPGGTQTGSLSAIGVHGDMDQYQSLLSFSNEIVLNNDMASPTIGYQQGLFSEVPIDGMVWKGNAFQNSLTSEYYVQVAAGQYNWTLSGNHWNEQGTLTSGFNFFGNTDFYLTDMNNICDGTPASGGLRQYTPGGTNVRAAAGGGCR